ncbi:hypothetical protein EC991_001545 [Linnemannia zychae]|nr:hypothetical protein EC991_001545 [Linnemannia zychae]
MITSKALRLTALFLALIINNPAPISAQSNPPGTAEMAFASVQDEVLYIQGGYSDTNYFTDQFYALDLTTDSWSPTNPPWKSLLSPSIYTPSNVRVTISNGMTVTKDQKRLFIWTATGVFWFDRETSLWESKVVDGLSDQGTLYYSYRRAATDGDTGLIYIPSAASGGSKMVVLDPDTITARVVNMPPASLISAVIQVYGWVWSSLRKSFIFTGGEYTSVNNGKTLEYFPSNDTWTELTTFGAKIPAISRHCMVSADMACTITGSNFISWGGKGAMSKESVAYKGAIFITLATVREQGILLPSQ